VACFLPALLVHAAVQQQPHTNTCARSEHNAGLVRRQGKRTTWQERREEQRVEEREKTSVRRSRTEDAQVGLIIGIVAVIATEHCRGAVCRVGCLEYLSSAAGHGCGGCGLRHLLSLLGNAEPDRVTRDQFIIHAEASIIIVVVVVCSTSRDMLIACAGSGCGFHCGLGDCVATSTATGGCRPATATKETVLVLVQIVKQSTPPTGFPNCGAERWRFLHGG
jgi:hypothetical protein